jgi:4a-hydroxytetrahydrobiopterin dehydratase
LSIFFVEWGWLPELATNRVVLCLVMTSLSQMKCEACRKDSPLATRDEIADWHAEIPEWSIVERDGIMRLERRFAFKNFADAVAFTNLVAGIAETEGHHPAVLTEWGSVTVTWWTHKIRGLHRNDFVMAAKTDQL